MNEPVRARRARAWWIVAVAALAVAAYLVLRDADVATPGEASPPAPRPPISESTDPPRESPLTSDPVVESMSAVAREASAGLAASVDLRGTVSSQQCSSAQGRAEALAMLAEAETAALRVNGLILQSVDLVRAAVDTAALDPLARQELRQDVAAATQRTLMLAQRLRATRLQAIRTARSLVSFMEENAGGFEVRDGTVRFTRQAAQDQFLHFQVNTSRVLAQELLERNETADALLEQEALLARVLAQH